MHLSGQQLQELWAAIGAGFEINTLNMFLRFHLERELDDVATLGATKPDRIFSALEHAQQNGWLCDLLAKLTAEGPNDSIKELATRLAGEVCAAQGGPGGGGDPLGACVVRGRRAFVDRGDFRSLMRDFRDEAQGRVAVIKGPSGGGNSYSWFFIEHLARETGTVLARLVDLKRWKGAGSPSPDELMEYAASRLGLAKEGWPTDDLAQGARRSDKLVDWLLERLPRLTEHCWLVIDHLNRVDLREDCVELVEQLAVEVETGNCENLSLVLIGFDRALSADLDPYLLRDAPSGFLGPQVRKHFRKLAEAAGHAISDGKMDELVEESFGGLAPPPNHPPDEVPFSKEEMQEIGGRLARLSARVLRGEDLQ